MGRYKKTIQTISDDFGDTTCSKSHNRSSAAQTFDTDQRMIICKCRIEKQIECRIETSQLDRLVHIGDMVNPVRVLQFLRCTFNADIQEMKGWECFFSSRIVSRTYCPPFQGLARPPSAQPPTSSAPWGSPSRRRASC